MASSMLMKVTCLAIICLALSIQLTNAGPSCDEINQTLTPCLEFLKNPGPSVPERCCNGVRSVADWTKTTPERQDACKCLKTTMSYIPELNLPAIAALPGNCGVNLPCEISPSMDCDKIQ